MKWTIVVAVLLEISLLLLFGLSIFQSALNVLSSTKAEHKFSFRETCVLLLALGVAGVVFNGFGQLQAVSQARQIQEELSRLRTTFEQSCNYSPTK